MNHKSSEIKCNCIATRSKVEELLVSVIDLAVKFVAETTIHSFFVMPRWLARKSANQQLFENSLFLVK